MADFLPPAPAPLPDAIKAIPLRVDESKRQSLTAVADTDLYASSSRVDTAQYVTSIGTDENDEDEITQPQFDESERGWKDRSRQFGAPQRFFDEMAASTKEEDPFKETRSRKIADREDEYRARRRLRKLSPPRADPFSASTAPAATAPRHKQPRPEPAGTSTAPPPAGDEHPGDIRSYKEVLKEAMLDREHQELLNKLKVQQEEKAAATDQNREVLRKKYEDELRAAQEERKRAAAAPIVVPGEEKKRRRPLPPGVKPPEYLPPPDAAPPSRPWRLLVFKRSTQLESHLLGTDRSFFFLGRCPDLVDVTLEHPSASKVHAVIQFRRVESGDVRPFLLDLGSTNGTQLDGAAIPAQQHVAVTNKSVFKFGMSMREYVLAPEGAQ
ncbi:putative Smad nuclear-interacting protein 1 [Paratrimastix pyriformis]|uniref:Smad nuclear-interacting protein 1 n=1 Tax=Paratrimastix pyriformis TaxID=342808 RepID=A0ABQ8UBJ4_9EUKA|nr:putative Smad nuclear-interacting protein 1 [Paratrimastix pyriformis]